jgi:hypothetical protein
MMMKQQRRVGHMMMKSDCNIRGSSIHEAIRSTVGENS